MVLGGRDRGDRPPRQAAHRPRRNYRALTAVDVELRVACGAAPEAPESGSCRRRRGSASADSCPNPARHSCRMPVADAAAPAARGGQGAGCPSKLARPAAPACHRASLPGPNHGLGTASTLALTTGGAAAPRRPPRPKPQVNSVPSRASAALWNLPAASATTSAPCRPSTRAGVTCSPHPVITLARDTGCVDTPLLAHGCAADALAAPASVEHVESEAPMLKPALEAHGWTPGQWAAQARAWALRKPG